MNISIALQLMGAAPSALLPPTGMLFLVDADGAFLTDGDGFYLVEAI